MTPRPPRSTLTAPRFPYTPLFRSLGPLLTYYGDYFGQPYPLPKLDNIAGPGQSQFFGAMENWGAIFTFERILLDDPALTSRSEEHTSELQSLMRISYAVFCLKKKKQIKRRHIPYREYSDR